MSCNVWVAIFWWLLLLWQFYGAVNNQLDGILLLIVWEREVAICKLCKWGYGKTRQNVELNESINPENGVCVSDSSLSLMAF